jgi:hypothetical protein
MSSLYFKKMKKHTRAVYLNTDDAYYVNAERTQFSFRIPPINVEDESILYVRNTNTDYKASGLSVRDIRASVFLGTGATYASTYNAPPSITFTPQDGKGSGATAVAVLAASGLSASATSTTTILPASIGGSGYAGATSLYPLPSIAIPLSGGQGASLVLGTFTTSIGAVATATLTAGSGFIEVPPSPVIPPPPPTTPATFDPVPFTASTGAITNVPAVLNPTTNCYYNTTTFVATFQNNPVVAQGFCQTDASGTITSISISNVADNGFYSSSDPISILAVNGVLIGSGGTGLAITPTYTDGRAVSIIVTNGGSGYGANLVDAPITFSLPATPVAGTITNKTISLGRLTALTFGTGGSKYKNPSIFIDPVSIAPPVQAVFAPLYKQGSLLQGVRMTSYGRGYTLPPRVLVGTETRIASANGTLPLEAEMTPTYLVEPNNYYTIKAEGFEFHRTLYTNSDNKGTPTLAVCSTNENVNNEDYVELVLPAQVINDFTLYIADRDGAGLDALKNMTLLLSIEEIEEKQTQFKDSRRQVYPNANYSVS